MISYDELYSDAIHLLDSLISTPSPSREESKTADILEEFLLEKGLKDVQRVGNNVFLRSAAWDENKPVLLLNAHHDTARPSSSYTRDPYLPTHENGCIYGLGSNDDGGSVVSLIAAFRYLYETPIAVNLLLAITAEEEVSGKDGISLVLPHLGHIDMGLVGEPTAMKAAIGERGLVVIDGLAKGVRGHAARDEGINALYIALDDIQRLRDFHFDRYSELLGDIKVSVTQISAGQQHNVVPDECRFVVDVRTTDAYTNEETVAILQKVCQSVLTPRSTRLRASAINDAHPLVRTALQLGRTTYVSPTMSDMALMPFPTLKMGPGDSARSHSADEYIREEEIREGIHIYIDFLKKLQL